MMAWFLKNWQLVLVGICAAVLLFLTWRVTVLKADLATEKANVEIYRVTENLNELTIDKMTRDHATQLEAVESERDNLADANDELADELAATASDAHTEKDFPMAPVLTDYFDRLRGGQAAGGGH